MPHKRITKLKDAIRATHGCQSLHVESVSVREVFEGQIVWQGTVEVFDLVGHPKAKRAYAWTYRDGDQDKTVAVLEIPPVDSPQSAVKAATGSKARPKSGYCRKSRILTKIRFDSQPLRSDMKTLARQIECQLRIGEWNHCAVYEADLQRLWPLDEEEREVKIAQFAKEHELCLQFYRKGLCALFDRSNAPDLGLRNHRFQRDACRFKSRSFYEAKTGFCRQFRDSRMTSRKITILTQILAHTPPDFAEIVSGQTSRR